MTPRCGYSIRVHTPIGHVPFLVIFGSMHFFKVWDIHASATTNQWHYNIYTVHFTAFGYCGYTYITRLTISSQNAPQICISFVFVIIFFKDHFKMCPVTFSLLSRGLKGCKFWVPLNVWLCAGSCSGVHSKAVGLFLYKARTELAGWSYAWK